MPAFLKVSALLASAPLLVSGAPAPQLPPYHYPAIVQVSCDESRGTAFRVGPHTFASAAHVTNASHCSVEGHPVNGTQEAGQDFSTFEYPASRLNYMNIDCRGFIPGKWYHAVGFARGWTWQTTLALLATYKTTDGQRVLLGIPTVIPGMSGGPILNSDGAVVGTVNAYRPGTALSYSVELKGTALCKERTDD